MQCPRSITISERLGASGKASDRNFLQLELKPVGIGLYPDRLLLRSEHETRVLDVMINVRELEHTYTLGFCCKARKGVIQQIPLFNSSDKSACITAEVRSYLYI